MSEFDLQALLQPIEGPLPCGENLEYDAGFLAMEQAATYRPEQEFGSTLIAAEAPDWQQVERLALELCQRTRDLRVMVQLGKAWTQLHGLDGYARALALIHASLERYWDGLHPALEFDGEFDPLPRIGCLAELGDRGELTQMLRACPLVGGAAPLSLRDAVALLDGSGAAPEGFPGGRPRLQQLLQAGTPLHATLAGMAERLEALRELAGRQLDEAAQPDMQQLRRGLALLLQEGTAAPAADVPGGAAGATDEAYRPGTRIASREQALQALDGVRDYFQAHEPSHPAPLLIERIRRLVARDFLGIVEDLAPEAMDRLNLVLGTSRDSP
ncbi:type VI secretion system protein ImpA [Pseudomonas delhiensis]|uniref:Type VI secretion system protein ImpA n=1 Tax=Pseudomonas delhiensis TaxID=366289 RepID=A0A239I9N8_9PSED|nr:type VI secretion system protein TssA [Pseudomonas delhiensis]SDK16144.1 type VI secretion system protein ImpA [Pseudomonas delhiensis]SNS90350.1 type VI secretion system protein ImpA [Pseudomonas delhiensis]